LTLLVEKEGRKSTNHLPNVNVIAVVCYNLSDDANANFDVDADIGNVGRKGEEYEYEFEYEYEYEFDEATTIGTRMVFGFSFCECVSLCSALFCSVLLSHSHLIHSFTLFLRLFSLFLFLFPIESHSPRRPFFLYFSINYTN